MIINGNLTARDGGWGVYTWGSLTVNGNADIKGGNALDVSDLKITGNAQIESTVGDCIQADGYATFGGTVTIKSPNGTALDATDDITFNNGATIIAGSHKGVVSDNGKIILVKGVLDSTASPTALIASVGIEYPSDYGVDVPAGGEVGTTAATIPCLTAPAFPQHMRSSGRSRQL